MSSRSSTPPRLVIIFGPAAVGKMTVGQELAKTTGFKLLYNHMVIDLVTQIVPFGTPAFHRIARSFTAEVLAATAENGIDLILTHGLLFSAPNARELIDELSAPFLAGGGSALYAELAAPLEQRLARNETENRRRHKMLDWATPDRLREIEAWGRWNSRGDFPYPDRHIMIENSDIAAADAARTIRERFAL